MTVEYLDLTDYVAIATEVTSLDTTRMISASRLDLVDPARHAPSADSVRDGTTRVSKSVRLAATTTRGTVRRGPGVFVRVASVDAPNLPHRQSDLVCEVRDLRPRAGAPLQQAERTVAA